MSEIKISEPCVCTHMVSSNKRAAPFDPISIPTISTSEQQVKNNFNGLIRHFRKNLQISKFLKLNIRVALFPKNLFKIVILHNIKRLFPKNSKNYKFSKNSPFEDCSFWHFWSLAQFSVLTNFRYFGFFGMILSRSMRENSVILEITLH